MEQRRSRIDDDYRALSALVKPRSSFVVDSGSAIIDRGASCTSRGESPPPQNVKRPTTLQ